MASSRAVQPPHAVVGAGHGRDAVDGDAVVENGAFVVEEDGGDQSGALLALLLGDGGVEAPHGVPLQPRHGAAAVRDEYDLGQIVVHEKTSLVLLWLQYSTKRGRGGRLAGDL